MAKQCAFIKPSGEQCGGFATTDSDFCISHNPSLAGAKLEAVKKGGAATSYEKLDLDLPEMVINNPTDVVAAATQTINELRSGQLPPKLASTLGYLLGIVLKAYEIANLDQRVEMIESVLIERRTAIKRKP